VKENIKSICLTRKVYQIIYDPKPIETTEFKKNKGNKRQILKKKLMLEENQLLIIEKPVL